MEEIEHASYNHHVLAQREADATERCHDLVKTLLEKLPESERTVITLYYLGGMKSKEIGKFLGVSVHTVTSRLQRARKRLEQEEDLLVQEILGGVHISTGLTQNIMRQVVEMTPTPAPTGKPLLPWMAFGTATVFVCLLMLGISNQYLLRFQKPYSFEALSERTIEITEAKQVVDSPEKPLVRNKVGRPDVPNKNNGAAQEPNSLLVDSTQADATKDSKLDDITQKGTVSLSGRVVNEDGNAVPGLQLAIKPVEFSLSPNTDVMPRTPFSSWKRVKTNKQGSFSFPNIDSVSSQLVMSPEAESDFEIISLDIGNVTFYSPGHHLDMPNWLGKMTFAIEPGIPLKNMVVTVRPPRMRIRGRILLKDGTPLANEHIGLTVRQRNRDTFLFFFSTGESSSTTSGSATTDSQGYFVSYHPDEAAEYSVSVEYESEKVSSRWFHIKEGQRYDKLVFRLKNVEKHRKIRKERIKAQQAIWTVNPQNGHAYKKIQCNSWNDAKAKAAAENAYLVAINDEAEQKWLEARFAENLFYWIGLNISKNKASSQWDNGEPLTYINWLTTEESVNESKVPVAMEFFSKRWMPIEADSPFLPVVKHAILEKKDPQ